MRILTLVVMTLVIASCNNSAGKKEDLPAETDIKDTTQPVKQMPEKPGSPDTVFTGFGNEPFWAVYVVKDRKIVFHPADGPDVELPYTAPSTVANSTQYNAVSGNNSIELVIVKKDCSDGMSDQTHPYSISLLVNKTKYTGCGREGK
jgi:uncharacterized membrane protein